MRTTVTQFVTVIMFACVVGLNCGKEEVTFPDPGGNSGPQVVNPIADQTLTEDQPARIVADLFDVFEDAEDGDNLIFEIVDEGDDPALLNVSLEGTNNRDVRVFPFPDRNGSTLITVRATDTENAATDEAFLVTVAPTADAPRITALILDTEIASGTGDPVDYVDLDDHFVDPDGEALTLEAGSLNSSILSASVDPVTHVVSLTPTGSAGAARVDVSAKDPTGRGTLLSFTVSVDALLPANRMGVFADQSGAVCVLDDKSSGVRDYFVVHEINTDATGVQFAVRLGPPTSSLTYVGEEALVPVAIGDTQNGVTLGYGQCLIAPQSIAVVRMTYSGEADTPPCTPFAVVPHPDDGKLIESDCNSFVNPVRGMTSFVAGNATCACQPLGTMQRIRALSAARRLTRTRVGVKGPEKGD